MAEPKQKEKGLSEAQIVTIIAGAIAIGASAKATATKLAPILGLPLSALLPLVRIAMSKPINYGVETIPSATASAESSRLESVYRAHYIYAASQRIKGLSGEALLRALRQEQDFFNQHLEAVRNRREKAAEVDKAAQRWGDELGWYAKLDVSTSPECREANGKNFSASRIPAIGWPGAVHPSCRCRVGRKHATSQTVYKINPHDGRRKSA